MVSKYQSFCLSCICSSRYRTHTSCNFFFFFFILVCLPFSLRTQKEWYLPTDKRCINVILEWHPICKGGSRRLPKDCLVIKVQNYASLFTRNISVIRSNCICIYGDKILKLPSLKFIHS